MGKQLLSPEQEKHLGLSDELQRSFKELQQKVRLQDGSDHRLLAIAATQMQLGFMALNKAICNPENGVSTERTLPPRLRRAGEKCALQIGVLVRVRLCGHRRSERILESSVELHEEIWSAALARLKTSLDGDVYSRWIAVISPVSLRDGVLAVAVDNEMLKMWVENNYLPYILDAARIDSAERVSAIEITVDSSRTPAAQEAPEPEPAAARGRPGAASPAGGG